MINYIYELCKEHNCTIDLCIGPDGAMTITVCGKRVDHTIIGVNWSEENIKDSINDTIRRACYD